MEELFLYGYCNVFTDIMHDLAGHEIYYYIGMNGEYNQTFLIHAMNRDEQGFYDAQGRIDDLESYLEDYESNEDIETEFELITGKELQAFKQAHNDLPTVTDLISCLKEETLRTH